VSETEYLDLEDLLAIVRALGIGPVRDIGLLDSVAARPRASAFTEDAYPTIELKAAALLHSLARNRPLVHGNKRLSWLAVVIFLDLNGCEVTLSDEKALRLVMDVACGDIELDEIVSRLQVQLSRERTQHSRVTSQNP
jgi:death-on-curing protein